MLSILLALSTIVADRSFAEDARAKKIMPSDVIAVATALDHLSVLEFAEPVVMAAAGSNDFQIERQGDKVLIKPLKPAASTNLFIWTATRRYTYELEAPGEVGQMTFAIDSAVPAPSPMPQPTPALCSQTDEFSDTLLTKALLGMEPVQNTSIKDRTGRVIARVEHVFRSANTLYIHYSLANRSAAPYRVLAPAVRQLQAPESRISLVPLERVQLDETDIQRLGPVKQQLIEIARAEATRQDVAPGNVIQGVVVIHQQFSSPAVLELEFGSTGGNRVRAVFVR